jgi:hypothetical protein
MKAETMSYTIKANQCLGKATTHKTLKDAKSHIMNALDGRPYEPLFYEFHALNPETVLVVTDSAEFYIIKSN